MQTMNEPGGSTTGSEQPPVKRPASPPDPGSIQIARIAGIPIRLHFTFLLLVAFLLIFTKGPSLESALFVVAIFGCIVLHELGHSVVAQRYGIRVDSITLYPIGGLARITQRPLPGQELWIALAGPAVNVVIAAVIYAALQSTGHWTPAAKFVPFKGQWLELIALANVWLALFNMVPAFPMDGGRVLRAILGLSGFSPVRATATAAAIGRLLAVIAGLVAVIYGQWILMFIAFFVWIGAGEEAAVVRQESVFTGVPVSSVMVTDIRTLQPGDSLKEAADTMLATSQHDFPIVLGDEVVGLVTREALLRGLATDGPGGYIAGAMNRDFPRARPEDMMTSIFSSVASVPPSARLPVLVLNDNRLVGMVTGENITEYFAIQQMLAIGARHASVGMRS